MANINLITILTAIFILQSTKNCEEYGAIGTKNCNTSNGEVSRGCNSDDRCHEYGDCCPSKIFTKKDFNMPNTTQSSTIKPKWECHDLHSVYVSQASGELIEELIQIYMIATCPITWKDPYTANLCERRTISQRRYTFLIDMPTVSQSTHNTYVNRYCAFCNSDSNNLEKWDLLIICPDEDPNCSTKKWKYIPGKWEFTRQAAINHSNVRLRLRTYTDFQEYEAKYNARTCYKIITEECQKTTIKHNKKRRVTDLEINVPKDDCGRCSAYNMPTCDHAPKTCQIYSCGSLIGKIFDGLCVSIPKSNITFAQHAISDIRGHVNKNKPSSRLSLQARCTKNFIIVSHHQIILSKNTVHFMNTHTTFENVEYEIVNMSLVELCLDLEEPMSKMYWSFNKTQTMMATVGFAVSQLCLLLHIIISIFLKKLDNLPGKNLFCLTISLFIAQLSFVFGLQNQIDTIIPCIALSVISHFGFLASFFWINVLAFDVFLSFAGNSTSISSNIGTRREFLRYSIYAWTVPLFIVSIAFAFEISDIVPDIKPYYTQQGICFINNSTAFQIFFLAPAILLVFENVVFLSIAKRIIYENAQKPSNPINNVDSTDCISRFSNYAKLTLVMFFTWTFGIVAAMLRIEVLFYPFIIANALQGLFIFILFKPKNNIYILLLRKYRTPTKDLDNQRNDRHKHLMQMIDF